MNFFLLVPALSLINYRKFYIYLLIVKTSFVIHSYDTHLPSDPSIETMSDSGIPSDQTIAIFYSGINHLTKGLQESDNDLDMNPDKIRLNEHCDSTKPFYAIDDIRNETDGEDDESSPYYNRINENISQYVHHATVRMSHESDALQHCDSPIDEIDGDQLNVGDFDNLSMLHSVNLKSKGIKSWSSSPLQCLCKFQIHHKATHRLLQRRHKIYGMVALKRVQIL